VFFVRDTPRAMEFYTATYTHWGAPTMVILDLDQNELFFWLSDAERAKWQEAHAGAA
jgi:hypothetical protein